MSQHSVLRDPGLYFRTLRHLKLSQFYYLIVRRLLPKPKYVEVPVGNVRRDFTFEEWQPVLQPVDLKNEFRFINETKSFNPDDIDWVCEDQKKLWRYNLHYFDFLHWGCFSDELKETLIDSWIQSCPINQPLSWDPYTTSLRVVNWIKYFGTLSQSRDIPAHWLESLLNQACWQAENMEYQILANHLVKNAKALVFAGVYFDCERSRKLLQLGCKVMLEQGREQYMTDGGHFERSHMYHQIVSEDYLDFVNLADHQDLPLTDTELSEIKAITMKAVGYYADLCAGDGELQLFNDSTQGIMAGPEVFLAYAERVLGEVVVERGTAVFVIDKPATGYFGYRNGGDSFLIDCGAVGPDYQPGHAHCDTLSFGLCIDGQRIIVDSGNYTYEHVTIRHENRQTAGHNTVRIDEEEQSEVWDVWRVGRRAYPIAAKLSAKHGGKLSFTGSHDGYQRLSGKVVHERQVEIDIAGRWQIADRISGTGNHLLESYLHLHPDVEPVALGKNAYELVVKGKPIARLDIDSGPDVLIEASAWCPEFGIAIENKVIVMRLQTALPVNIGYTISRL